jgi:hypothetical protein
MDTYNTGYPGCKVVTGQYNATANKSNNGGTKKYRSRRQLFRDGQCVAALHALLAAQAYAAGWFETLKGAAVSAGSNVHYCRAALTLLKSGDETLISHVCRGNVSILSAAAQVEPQVKLIEAYWKASSENLKAFRIATGATADLTTHLIHSSAEQRVVAARSVGIDVVWDTMIAPVITPAE